MVNINTDNNEEMVLIQFCGNIFFWIFSVVDHKSVTDAGIIDSFLAKPSLLKSNFCIRSLSRVAGLGRLSAGAKMAMKPFVKRVFTIFATNASFLRVISNFRI